MPQRRERLQEFLHVGSASAVEVLGDLLGGQRLAGVGHDGADGLGARLEAGRPVQWFRRRSIAANVEIEVHLGLRFDGLGGLVRGAEVADVALLFLPAALLFEHVVERGHGEVVVPVQALFAVLVELLAQITDRGFLVLGRRVWWNVERRINRSVGIHRESSFNCTSFPQRYPIKR